ncbi:MAG: DUF1566 domain-containing protein [Desulfovibrionaceae bacterium]
MIPLPSGQRRCFDAAGRAVPCPGSGQDAAFHAAQVPAPGARFGIEGPAGALVRDRLTGLVWTREAPTEFPLPWAEALDLARAWNAEGRHGARDWRLPNRRELFGLVSFATRDPALPEGHPFLGFTPNWHWTGTSSAVNPAYAWYVHFAGGRMFYGRKDQDCLVRLVRGAGQGRLAATGQTRCFDAAGAAVPCAGTGQDGELRRGAAWPEPRFAVQGEAVRDRLTGLTWARRAEPEPTDWPGALAAVRARNERAGGGQGPWRLPSIPELESLVDAGQAAPALPQGHPFVLPEGADVYWSATSSAYEPDWAMALYLNKGAVGVGHKTRGDRFLVRAVRGPAAGTEAGAEAGTEAGTKSKADAEQG